MIRRKARLIAITMVICSSLVLLGGSALAQEVDANASGVKAERFSERSPGNCAMKEAKKGQFPWIKKKVKPSKGNKMEGFKKILDDLVSSNTITQEKADKIIEYCKNLKRSENVKDQERKHPLDQLLEEKGLTPEQATAIKKALLEKKESPEQALGELVKQGILTQKKADEVKEYFLQRFNHKKNRAERMEKLLNELMDEEIITEAEKNDIQKEWSKQSSK